MKTSTAWTWLFLEPKIATSNPTMLNLFFFCTPFQPLGPAYIHEFHASPPLFPLFSLASEQQLLKTFSTMEKLFRWLFKGWILFLSFYVLSLPQYHHSILLPSPAFIERYTRLIGLISLSSPLQYYLSKTWDPTLPYHLSLLIPPRIYLALFRWSCCHRVMFHSLPRPETHTQLYSPGVRNCFSQTGQCGKCQFRSGPSWTYDWKCEGPRGSCKISPWKIGKDGPRGAEDCGLQSCQLHRLALSSTTHQNLPHDAGVTAIFVSSPVLCALQVSRIHW